MPEKLKRIKVEETLKSLGIILFSPVEFAGVFKVALKRATDFISTNLASGLFLKLRNGLYMIKDAHASLFLIANKLYEPSYVSLGAALSHYGIIPETVYAITSVTTKISREFDTPKGDFIYRSIKKTAFTGYGLRLVDKDKVMIADPEKALADFLYFVDLKQVRLNDRLDLKKIKKMELIKFVRLFERPSMLKLVDQIYVDYKKPGKIY